MTMAWDEEFLSTRRRDMREVAMQAQFDADWQEAAAQVARDLSDAAGAYRICPRAPCRRARRCRGETPVCIERLGIALRPAAMRDRTEQVYAEIQLARRELAAQTEQAGVE
jgi:hypothetical protein